MIIGRHKMDTKTFIILLVSIVSVTGCYWNAECPYLLHSTKTPYDTIRGDIRDYPSPANCEAVSIWNINRHGNRNPGSSATVSMKALAALKDDIIASYEAGTSQLCAQDIDLFRQWSWNETLEISQSFLTGTGYEELYGMGKRIGEAYPHLLQGTPDEYHFRPTNVQRTIASGMAFVHGFTEGVNLNVTLEEARDTDDVIRPYANCDRYQDEVKEGQTLNDQLEAYFKTPEFVAVQNAAQQRLSISTTLTSDDIYMVYELCRFYRSWTETLQSPWCAAFNDEDLIVLEYYDDVRHYYRNGYGSWVNVNLGGIPLKDLYESFEAVVQGGGRKVVSYYTHNAMMEMVYCAMSLFRDDAPLQASVRSDNRLWKTSFISAFSVNVIAVLNRCESSASQYRVQLFVNEKETTLCPLEGCTWQEFQEKFQPFANANLDFCNPDYVYDVTDEPASNGASISRGFWSFL